MSSSYPQDVRWGRLLICILFPVVISQTPHPSGLSLEGWRLLGVFGAVILGFLLHPVAMGPMVLLGLLACPLLNALDFETALAGYGEKVVWLVVGAFILASAVRSTGLGRRIALWLVVKLGRTTLGLGYAQAVAEFVLGPLVPSNTARGGGILAPICASLARALGSEPGSSPERGGAYLALVGSHTNLVAAAMFMTGMAANPLYAEIAEGVYGVEFGWAEWALAAIVPGLIAMACLPALLYVIARPTIRDVAAAREAAREQLREMGPLSRNEKIMSLVFLAMLLLWSMKLWLPPLGQALGIAKLGKAPDTTLVALMGVAALVVTRAHSWAEVIRDHAAWDTLIWLGGLLAMANGLRDQGVVDWLASSAGSWVEGSPMLITLLLLALIYFFSMYGFSMLTAHISAMAGAFLGICFAAEVPALLAIPLFAVFSNLCACTTNYSSGPVIIYYGLGYVPTGAWFRVGFVVAIMHLVIWICAGLAWWKLLGWW